MILQLQHIETEPIQYIFKMRDITWTVVIMSQSCFNQQEKGEATQSLCWVYDKAGMNQRDILSWKNVIKIFDDITTAAY